MRRLIVAFAVLFMLCAVACFSLAETADFYPPKTVAEGKKLRQKYDSAYEDFLKKYSPSKTTDDSNRTQGSSHADDDSSVVMVVSWDANCKDYNHVGNEWEKRLYLNKKEVIGFTEISVRNGECIVVECVIREGNEKYPDKASCKEEIWITPEIMMEGYEIKKIVKVKESNGRYAGNQAIWHVTVTIKPLNED